MGQSIQTTAEIRSQNTKKIIEHLRYREYATKKELAENLKLSFVTISNICNALVSDGLLLQTTSSQSSGGRIPELLAVNEKAKFFLCIDLVRKDMAETALISVKNRIVAAKTINFGSPSSINSIVAAIRDLTMDMLKEQSIGTASLLGIGISVPGVHNRNKGRFSNSTKPGNGNKPIEEIFFNAFKIPVYIENESNLLAMASSRDNSGEYTYSELVYVYIGDNLDVGIISRGELITGFRGLGSGVSHMPIGNDSFRCYCGNTGCIESELIHSGFIKKYNQRSNSEIQCSNEGWQEFRQLIASRNKDAMAVIDENGRLIGKLLSILQNIFDPEVFFIGGLDNDVYTAMQSRIDDELRSRSTVGNHNDIPIEYSKDYLHLLKIGCAELVFKNWNP